MPYVSSKKNGFCVVHEIPFIFMANQVLLSLQYTKFTVQLCPLTPVGDLIALNMDSRSLFVLLCSTHGKDRRVLQVYDFDGGSIPSGNAALELKDAMFDFFFDLNKVEQICQSITGVFIKYPVPCNCDDSLNKLKGPSMPLQDFQSAHEAERREILLKAELTATDREHDKLLNKTIGETSGETSGKTDGKGEQMPNEELYWLIEGEKEKRDKTNAAIGKLSAIRRELYRVHRYLLESDSSQKSTSKKPLVVPPVIKNHVKN